MAFVKWIMAKLKMDTGKAEQADVRDQIIRAFDEIEPDHDGHRVIVFDEPIEGYGSVAYQRRVTVVPNTERALEILEEHNLLEECTVTIRSINEEALMNAVYDGRLAESLLTEMYPQKETFAVVVKRA
jgi:hypothetical protein